MKFLTSSNVSLFVDEKPKAYNRNDSALKRKGNSARQGLQKKTFGPLRDSSNIQPPITIQVMVVYALVASSKLLFTCKYLCSW